MKESELRQGETYQTESGILFELISPYDPNTECFKRISDGSLHYGREFIEYENGKRIIDLSQAVSLLREGMGKDECRGNTESAGQNIG